MGGRGQAGRASGTGVGAIVVAGRAPVKALAAAARQPRGAHVRQDGAALAAGAAVCDVGAQHVRAGAIAQRRTRRTEAHAPLASSSAQAHGARRPAMHRIARSVHAAAAAERLAGETRAPARRARLAPRTAVPAAAAVGRVTLEKVGAPSGARSVARPAATGAPIGPGAARDADGRSARTARAACAAVRARVERRRAAGARVAAIGKTRRTWVDAPAGATSHPCGAHAR
jgi:hypothetical protein